MKKYLGIELKEVTESQVFDPPKEMLVWDDEPSGVYKRCVVAIASKRLEYPVLIMENGGCYRHCAEIPEEVKQKLATYRQLARWLAEGKGEMRRDELDVFTDVSYDFSMAYDSVDADIFVRKWSDTEWHKPTREYLGLEDK